MDPILIGIFAYLLVQLIVGIVVSRRIRTEEDYLLAGRSLGQSLATFSIFATWFGAESCIGTAGAAYERGWSGVTSDPFGYAICLLLMGSVLAAPLWKLKLTTVADLFRQRYSPGLEKLAACLMIPTSLLWAAAQIRAFGIVLSSSSDFDVTLCITVAAIFVIAYTAMGGLLADATTDVIQGIAVIIGLVILLPMVFASGNADPDVIPLIESSATGSVGWLSILERMAVPVCGSLLAQELVSRVIATRSPQIARRAAITAGVFYLVVGLIPVAVGLVGPQLMPDLEDPESILPTLAQKYFSPLGYVIFAGAILSAILSTVDSALLAASALFSHNIVLRRYPQISEGQKLWFGRLGVALMGILAYILALHAEGVYDLVKDASSFGSAGIFVVVLFGIFTKFGGRHSGSATLVSGTIVWVVASYGFDFEFSYLLALGASFLTYVSIGSFEERQIKSQHNP